MNVCCCLGAILGLSCSSEIGHDREAGAPKVLLVDSVRFLEDDTLFVARPIGFAVGVIGRVVIADVFQDKVFVFDDVGHPIQVLGGAGQGPGEYLMASRVFLQADKLMVWDAGPRKMVVYDWPLGDLVREFRLPVSVTSVKKTDEGLVIGALSSTSDNAVHLLENTIHYVR